MKVLNHVRPYKLGKYLEMNAVDNREPVQFLKDASDALAEFL